MSNAFVCGNLSEKNYCTIGKLFGEIMRAIEDAAPAVAR